MAAELFSFVFLLVLWSPTQECDFPCERVSLLNRQLWRVHWIGMTVQFFYLIFFSHLSEWLCSLTVESLLVLPSQVLQLLSSLKTGNSSFIRTTFIYKKKNWEVKRLEILSNWGLLRIAHHLILTRLTASLIQVTLPKWSIWAGFFFFSNNHRTPIVQPELKPMGIACV